MMYRTPLIVAGLVFSAIACVHLARLYYHFPVVIGSYAVPLWMNGIGFLIAFFLAAWMFRSLCCKKSCE